MSGSIGHVRTAEDRFRFTTGIARTVGKVCLAQMPGKVLVLLAPSELIGRRKMLLKEKLDLYKKDELKIFAEDIGLTICPRMNQKECYK